MSLWPSRGLDLHGFEIKVYRNDFLRELKTPEKAEDVSAYCDFWWVVAGGPEVVDLERDAFPSTWGLLIADGRGLVQARAAERRPKVEAIGRDMLAAILRRASGDMIPKLGVEAAISAARDEGEERGLARGRRETAPGEIERELAALKASVREFEAAAGVKLSEHWDKGQLGRAVKMALAFGEHGIETQLDFAKNQLKRALLAIDDARTAPTEAAR
jgi:hypothetical protein